eukprot:TRINITY_DN4074_c0_g3_i2.p1 TRINITY_DN4074_c0_g3~~TRINITY_DN4074_c0_g3_i2.p1  ORF type:complete len:500 (-),score=94.89 TRINITY_DN4074_c0_g3_i2:168-1667(-)
MAATVSNETEFSRNGIDEVMGLKTEENASLHKQGKWSREEDELLKKTVSILGERQWRKISDQIPGRTAIQCLHRWTKILKPGLVKGPWTLEEDERLTEWVRREGPTKWAQAAAFITGRSGKQCRERWFNNLNPCVKKGSWSEEEDELIFKLYKQYGSSWSKIAKFLVGRTENSIKNRFYSTLRKISADKKKTDVKDCSRNPTIEIPTVVKKEAEECEKVLEKEGNDTTVNQNANNFLYKLLSDGALELRKRRSTDRELESILGNDSKESKSKGKKKRQTKAREFDRKSNTPSEDSLSAGMSRSSFGSKNIKIEPIESQRPAVQTENMNTSSFSQLFNSKNIEPSKFLTSPNTKIGVPSLLPSPPIAIPTLQTSNIDEELRATHTIESEFQSSNGFSLEQKMVFLMDKLHTLENMLSNTRRELVKLELSMGDQELATAGQLWCAQQEPRIDYLGEDVKEERSDDAISEESFGTTGFKNPLDNNNLTSRLLNIYEEFFNHP